MNKRTIAIIGFLLAGLIFILTMGYAMNLIASTQWVTNGWKALSLTISSALHATPTPVAAVQHTATGTGAFSLPEWWIALHFHFTWSSLLFVVTMVSGTLLLMAGWHSLWNSFWEIQPYSLKHVLYFYTALFLFLELLCAAGQRIPPDVIPPSLATTFGIIAPTFGIGQLIIAGLYLCAMGILLWLGYKDHSARAAMIDPGARADSPDTLTEEETRILWIFGIGLGCFFVSIVCCIVWILAR